MNRLALAKRLAKECGISPTGPTTTINQTGEFGRIVEWVDTAYQDILNMHRGKWKFLRSDASISLSSGTSVYSVDDLKHWLNDDARVYLTSLGTDDESEIYPYEYADFKRTYLFGSARSQTGRPTDFTVDPKDESIIFWPVPDNAYTFLSEYYKHGEAMTADADAPVFHEDYHMVIVWRGLIYYGSDYVEPDKYHSSQYEYKRLIRSLELDQLDQLKLPGMHGPLC